VRPRARRFRWVSAVARAAARVRTHYAPAAGPLPSVLHEVLDLLMSDRTRAKAAMVVELVAAESASPAVGTAKVSPRACRAETSRKRR
jgi:hypothetical protein